MDSGLPSVISQPVVASLTRSAILLVVTIDPGSGPEATVRGLCADLSALLRAVGFRDLKGNLTCVMGFGSQAWDRLFDGPRPQELHPFREIRGVQHVVATRLIRDRLPCSGQPMSRVGKARPPCQLHPGKR